MYLLERQKKILTILLSCDGWITGEKIGRALGITDRTVRNDIRIINEELQKYTDSVVESIRGKGYFLVSKERNILLEKLEKMDVGETTEGRLYSIALEILMSEEPVPLDDLEEEFYISRTTLEAVIKSINDIFLESLGSNLIVHKKNAVFTKVDEEKRREVVRRFIAVQEAEITDVIKDEYGYLDKEYTSVLIKLIRKVLAKHGLQLTDQDMIDTVLFLYIQTTRVPQGGELKESIYEKPPKILQRISDEIFNLLEEKHKKKYGKTERKRFAVWLCDIRMMRAERFTKKEIEAIIELKYLVIVEELLNDIKNEFMLDLTRDEELFVDLVLHIRFSIKFGKSSVHQSNPLLDTMKNRYPFVFELSTWIFGRFYDVLGIELNENQLGYIAAHLGAALERLETQQARSDFKIAVCSNMSIGVVRLLMAKLHSLYMNSVEISGPYPVYDMGKMLEEKPSLILTTTSANLFQHTSLPVITILPTLEAEDVLTINREISRLKREKVVFGLPDGIEKYFEEDLYFPQIELENRESVLEYLCNKIVQKGYASEELFTNTLEREKIAPTTFANQIAMPHPMRSCAYKTVIAVAVLKKPVFWGNLNVRLVFLLVVRGSDMRYMNSFFDLTSKLMWEKKKIKKLLSLSKFEEFIEELV